MSASQWTSSGCDSGWTLYLDQSSYSRNQVHSFGGGGKVYGGEEGARMEDDEEDDLSMVSDASSWPRHCNAEESCDELDKKSKKKIKKKRSKEHCGNQYQSSLDDTASSPVLGSPKDVSLSENVLGSSQGFSATNSKGKSSFKNHFELFPLCKESGGLRGRKAQ